MAFSSICMEVSIIANTCIMYNKPGYGDISFVQYNLSSEKLFLHLAEMNER